jgi:hypothetical protein
MTQENIKQLVQHAMNSFRIAENELNRPTEDSVTLCACTGTRNSINQFLHSYLKSKSADKSEMQLNNLLNQCISIDSSFSGIDLSCFKCGVSSNNDCDGSYCLSAEKVTECFDRAKAVKKLVLEKLQMSERDFELFF